MKNHPPLFDIPNCDLPDPDRQEGKARLQRVCRDQIEMTIACLNDLVAIDHKVRQVWRYVENLDLSKSINTIKSVEGCAGRPAIDPKILITLWLYATIEGIGSARVLAQYTKDHIVFKWICGGVPIERRTISQFRTDNGQLFDDLLAQGITILINAGAVKLEEVAQDGLRVRASAGRSSFRRKETIKELYALAKERVKQLKSELEKDPSACRNRQEANKQRANQDRLERLEKAEEEFRKYTDEADKMRKKHKKKLLTDEEKKEVRVSTTDSEARIMKMADGGFRPAYNFQFAVDTNKNIIIETDVVNAGTDGGQMLPMYEAIKKKYGKGSKNYLADGGYKSKTDIEQMTKDGCEVFVPVQEKGKKPYEPKSDESEEIGQWRTRMGKEESKIVYKRRAATVELVNANVRSWGLCQVAVRGLTKVKGIASMFAVAYNMIRTLSLGIA